MSSALDGRIRTLAREEAVALSNTQNDLAPDLQQQITDLHEHLHQATTVIKRLEARLDAMEKAAGQTGQQEALPAARRARRTGE